MGFEAIQQHTALVELNQYICECDDFRVMAPQNAIGGDKGLAGTILIMHASQLPFVAFNDEDLQSLTGVIQKVLLILKGHQIENTLIFGRESAEGAMQFYIIPYPNCSNWEKVKGVYQVIFGAPTLPSSKLEEIGDFYRNCWGMVQEEYSDALISEQTDPFCNEKTIARQEIERIETSEGRIYHLLYDYRPIGDPHFLIIPDAETGHRDPFSSSSEQRLDVLRIAQKQMSKIANQNSETVYMERLGKDLRSVDHFHGHVIRVKNVEDSCCGKWSLFFKALFPSYLSDSDLEKAIKYYKGSEKED